MNAHMYSPLVISTSTSISFSDVEKNPEPGQKGAPASIRPKQDYEFLLFGLPFCIRVVGDSFSLLVHIHGVSSKPKNSFHFWLSPHVEILSAVDEIYQQEYVCQFELRSSKSFTFAVMQGEDILYSRPFFVIDIDKKEKDCILSALDFLINRVQNIPITTFISFRV